MAPHDVTVDEDSLVGLALFDVRVVLVKRHGGGVEGTAELCRRLHRHLASFGCGTVSGE